MQMMQSYITALCVASRGKNEFDHGNAKLPAIIPTNTYIITVYAWRTVGSYVWSKSY